MSIDWSRVAEIVADALEMPAQQRAAYVGARCRENPELLAAVERMLAADAAAETGFLGELDSRFVEAAVQDARSAPDRVGPWRLLEEIGRGGMGQVFLAERADGQFEQRVAVKLLKRGMDSDAILARFLRERQILAGLEHPNIARLLDGGIAEDHRPYFVMELVEGAPITEYADTHRLTIDERLSLFRTVCDAVVHAHRNLVVHRDLKPSNILVTYAAVPKLLDFGIAKMLRAEENDASPTLTIGDVRLMTPAYAAPEQFAGGPITTATDVYGLGAVLYELLSGRKPFAGHVDRLRLPADTEPVPLASGLERGAPSEARTTPEERAAARATDPARLRHRLTGDLETIVAKAMRADPDRRYASVNALEEDLRRHQARLPVRARPDTLGYRASRFVRRHRLEVVAATTIVVLALAFGITATVQSRALESERDRARLEAATAREVSSFMVGVFEVADPLTPGGTDTIRAADLLARGAQRIEGELSGQPALQARLLGVIGQAYANLQQPDRAIAVLEHAVAVARDLRPPDSTALVAALQRLAVVRGDRGDFGEAREMIAEAIEVQERIDSTGVAMWLLLVDLGAILDGTGDADGAGTARAQARALFAGLPPDAVSIDDDILSRMNAMVVSAPDRAGADSIFARMVEITRAAGGEYGGAHAEVLRRWAGTRTFRGEWDAADTLFEKAVSIEQVRDSTSLVLANLLAQYAGHRVNRGDEAGAIPVARRAVRLMEARLGPEDRQVAHARIMLAEALYRSGRPDDAVAEGELVLRTLDRDPEDAALAAVRRWRHAAMLRAAGRVDEALATFDMALNEFETLFPHDYSATADVRRDYGDLLVEVGRPAEAEPMLRRSIEVLAARWGDEDVRVDVVRVSLGTAVLDLGRAAEAATLLRPVAGRLEADADRGPDDDLARSAREALERAERSRWP